MWHHGWGYFAWWMWAFMLMGTIAFWVFVGYVVRTVLWTVGRGHRLGRGVGAAAFIRPSWTLCRTLRVLGDDAVTNRQLPAHRQHRTRRTPLVLTAAAAASLVLLAGCAGGTESPARQRRARHRPHRRAVRLDRAGHP